jgi:hypothetical protein
VKFDFSILTGFNLKDSISNLAGVLILLGSILSVGTRTKIISADYQKQSDALIGIGGVLVAYVTGKRGDLKAGQIDEAYVATNIISTGQIEHRPEDIDKIQ